MRVYALSLGALAVTIALGAPAHVAAQDYYSDVRPVLVESCMGCHTQEGIGWSMEDAEATYEEHRKIAGAVTTGIMPPWLADPGHQEYLDDLSLPQDVVGMVASWREAGYPKGDPRPDPTTAMSGFAPFSTDLALDVFAGSYLPNQEGDDDYRCFVVDWTETEPMYVTGFRSIPGNLNIAHHVVASVVEPEMLDRYKELDTMTEGPGWECFGGPLPSDFDWDAYEVRYPDGQNELSDAQWWLTHWAPGMYGAQFPEGTGIRVRPGSGLVVQIHYYTADARGQSDHDTQVEFETAPEVEKPAFMLVQTRNRWLDSENNESMIVLPGEQATYVLSERLSDYVSQAASVADVNEDQVQGFEIYSTNLHMHAFGIAGDITLTDGEGRTETLLEISDYNLHWQRDFGFVEPKVFDREGLDGASLRVRCTYENNTDDVVYGGYGSFDEMCFTMSYVAVQLGEVTVSEGGTRER